MFQFQPVLGSITAEEAAAKNVGSRPDLLHNWIASLAFTNAMQMFIEDINLHTGERPDNYVS